MLNRSRHSHRRSSHSRDSNYDSGRLSLPHPASNSNSNSNKRRRRSRDSYRTRSPRRDSPEAKSQDASKHFYEPARPARPARGRSPPRLDLTRETSQQYRGHESRGENAAVAVTSSSSRRRSRSPISRNHVGVSSRPRFHEDPRQSRPVTNVRPRHTRTR